MENVMVCLSGRKKDEDTYAKKYIYSLGRQKLIKPKLVDEKDNGYYWEDIYYLMPGKYLVIEVDLDNTKHNCVCKRLKVFTKEDYLSDNMQRFPNLEIREINALYHYGGWKLEEWEGFLPNWVEAPCKCLYQLKRLNEKPAEDSEDDRQKRVNYKQPKEVEDILGSLLSKEEDEQKPSKFLIHKHKKDLKE